MSEQPPDFSFERDGRSLSDWLVDLVGDDASARLAAGEAIQAMFYAVPSVHTDVAEIDWESSSRDPAGHPDRFKDAVRTAVKAPGFPSPEFVRRLIRYRIALKNDWSRRVEQMFPPEKATSGALQERLTKRIQEAGNDAERAEATRRFTRWVCAGAARNCKRNESITAGAESLTAPGFMSHVVFDALDVGLLADRPGLWAMLRDKSMFNDAATALARIGPPAVDFAEFFLDRLAAQDNPYGFDGAHALGSIGRDEPAVIDALLKHLASGPDPVRIGAAQALGHAGPPLAGRLEVALDLLLGASYQPNLVHPATVALASVGREREDALRRVLELAAPKPPRWRTEESYPDHRYDEVMRERGSAIDALTHFRHFTDRVMPVLIDAFDSFDEYDSDWDYHGDHGRVCGVLRSFGPDAAPATSRLVRYLEGWWNQPEAERSWPREIFDMLASIGPPAAEALPTLEWFRPLLIEEGETPSDALDPDEPLDQAILAIRGHIELGEPG